MTSTEEPLSPEEAEAQYDPDLDDPDDDTTGYEGPDEEDEDE